MTALVFFQNSCPAGNRHQDERDGVEFTAREVDSGRPMQKWAGGSGGYTCCIPGCFNNSKRENHLSFYHFPNGISKDKQLLRKRWINMVSRKDFKPTLGHRVCSEHFVGGKKTYMNNVPTITPKTVNQKPRYERKTVKARNRVVAEDVKGHQQAEEHLNDGYRPEHDSLPLQSEEEVGNVDDNTEELLRAQIAGLLQENSELRAKNEELLFEKISQKEETRELSLEKFKDDDKLFKFYTGIPDYPSFQALFRFLGPAAHNLVYKDSKTNSGKIVTPEYTKRGPKRPLTPEQELFLVLVRLRLGLLEEDLAYRAGISQSRISRIRITWFDFLHCRFRALPIWPSRSSINDTMPQCFKETYPTTRVVIDCTEIFIEMSSSVRSQSVTYSNYKHHNTAKALIGITPAGAVSFASDLYTGRTSDKQATRNCGIINLLEEGDTIMADKGFDIADDLPHGISLNIPPFLRGKDSLSIEEEKETRKIASVRIHVERAIARIKTFKILSTVFPLSMAVELNKIWVICAYLTNFLPPLIADDK